LKIKFVLFDSFLKFCAYYYMRKNFEKFIIIAASVLSVLFALFLLLLVFSPKMAADANNSVVKTVFIILAVILIGLLSLSIWSAFSTSDKVNQILLFKTKGSSKKISVEIIRKLSKETVKKIMGVKITGMYFFVTDTSEIVMKASIKIDMNKVGEGVEKPTVLLDEINTMLANEFQQVLEFQFAEIELKLISLKRVKEERHTSTLSAPASEADPISESASDSEPIPAEHAPVKKSQKPAPETQEQETLIDGIPEPQPDNVSITPKKDK